MLLRVQLNRSPYLAAAIVSAHVGCACILIPLDLPNEAKLAIAITLGLSLARSVWSVVLLRSPGAVIAVELRDEGRLAVQTRDGDWHDARLLGTTYTTPLLTILNLRCEKRLLSRHVVIAGDSTEAEAFRRLRVWLRWGYRDMAGPAQPSSLS